MQLAELQACNSGEKLHVARAKECNTQLGNLTAHRLPAALIDSINRCCDVRGDDDRNRADLIAEAATLPPHLMADAREHFDAEAERFSHACALPGHQPATERTPE